MERDVHRITLDEGCFNTILRVLVDRRNTLRKEGSPTDALDEALLAVTGESAPRPERRERREER